MVRGGREVAGGGFRVRRAYLRVSEMGLGD